MFENFMNFWVEGWSYKSIFAKIFDVISVMLAFVLIIELILSAILIYTNYVYFHSDEFVLETFTK